MTKDEILDALEDERENLIDAIEGLSDLDLLEAGVVEDWSIKDILAHLSAWEAELVKLLWQARQPGAASQWHLCQRGTGRRSECSLEPGGPLAPARPGDGRLHLCAQTNRAAGAVLLGCRPDRPSALALAERPPTLGMDRHR